MFPLSGADLQARFESEMYPASGSVCVGEQQLQKRNRAIAKLLPKHITMLQNNNTVCLFLNHPFTSSPLAHHLRQVDYLT